MTDLPTTTRRLVCEAYGPPDQLTFETAQMPRPRDHEVLVRVRAAGVGFVDGLMVQGRYQVKPPLPYYPGSEFAGEVIAVGNAVTDLSLGQRVLGLGNGAFAEHVIAPAASCQAIPERMSDADAAGFYINYATALYGLKTCGDLRSGEVLLILGASGGVGSAAISVAKALGATVIAAASSETKVQAALAAGADAGVCYAGESWREDLREVLDDRDLNMVYDPVGGDVAEPALRSLAPGGRFMVVGFASGTIPRIPLNLALLKRCSIIGVDWGGESRADPAMTPPLLKTLLTWVDEGRLIPAPVSVRPLDDAPMALTDQLNGRLVGKLVLTAD